MTQVQRDSGTVNARIIYWGVEGAGPSAGQAQGIARTVAARFGRDVTPRPPPRLAEIALRAPRVAPPTALAALYAADPETRAGHRKLRGSPTAKCCAAERAQTRRPLGVSRADARCSRSQLDQGSRRRGFPV